MSKIYDTIIIIILATFKNYYDLRLKYEMIR